MQRAPSCTAVTIEQTSRSIALSINTCVTQRTRRGRTISAVALLALLAGCEIKRPPPPASPNGRWRYRKLSFDRKTAAAILPAWCGRATRSISASVSPARSWLAPSMSAIASVPAMWWRNSTRRTRSCKPRARRPNSRAATSNLSQAAADLARYTTLNARGYASLADFDRKKAANDEARKAASIVP